MLNQVENWFTELCLKLLKMNKILYSGRLTTLSTTIIRKYNNNLEYSKNLLNKAIKEQRQLTDAKLTVEEVKKHYESNENKNKYEKLLLEDKKKQKQKYEKMLLKDQQKRKNRETRQQRKKEKRLVTYQF